MRLLIVFCPFWNAGRIDKVDSSFQRSRSSSMSSLENIATETISCLTFADSYTKKSGTSLKIFSPWKMSTLLVPQSPFYNFFCLYFQILTLYQLCGLALLWVPYKPLYLILLHLLNDICNLSSFLRVVSIRFLKQKYLVATIFQTKFCKAAKENCIRWNCAVKMNGFSQT